MRRKSNTWEGPAVAVPTRQCWLERRNCTFRKLLLIPTRINPISGIVFQDVGWAMRIIKCHNASHQSTYTRSNSRTLCYIHSKAKIANYIASKSPAYSMRRLSNWSRLNGLHQFHLSYKSMEPFVPALATKYWTQSLNENQISFYEWMNVSNSLVNPVSFQHKIRTTGIEKWKWMTKKMIKLP